jgi:hypothetical protein
MLLSQVRTASGGALVGGHVHFYESGGTTPKAVWTDVNKTVVAANPYQLTANGTALLYGDGLYRLVIHTSTDAVAYDFDNIRYEDIGGAVTRITSIAGDGTGSITGFNIPLYVTQSLSLLDAVTAWVDVRAYGAKGDGVTDSATAIDSAMNACSAAGGGTVFIPKGTFLLGTVSVRTGSANSYIVPKDNCNIVGMGEGSVLKIKAGENVRLAPTGPRVIYTTALLQNATFRDFVIDGNGLNNLMDNTMAAQAQGQIASEGGGYNILVENMTFKNGSGNNPVAFSGTTGTRGLITVQNCRFLEMGSAIAGNHNIDHTDIYLLGRNIKVLNNYHKSSAHVLGAAFENHGINFEASGNYIYEYSAGSWIASDTGNCGVSNYHNNIFDNVYIPIGFSPGNNNGFGTVNIYNNTVRQSPNGSSAVGVYMLYGPDTVSDTADEINVYNNKFYAKPGGTDVRLYGIIGTKIARFYDNYAEGFGSYGVVFPTGAWFDGTYSAYEIDLHGNTYKNFSGGPISDFGSTIKRLNISNEKIYSDNSVTRTAIHIHGTVIYGGSITGNLVDNTYDSDISLGSGMTKVAVLHNLTKGFDRNGNWAAIGSKIFDRVKNRTLTKIATDNTWYAEGYGASVPPPWYDETSGDFLRNTGTDNIIGWKYTGAAWKSMTITLAP